MRELGLSAKFYQSSTSEMFGGCPETAPQSELTQFSPKSPYATSKLYAHWASINYRELMIFLYAVVSCLIMSHLDAVKHSSLKDYQKQ